MEITNTYSISCIFFNTVSAKDTNMLMVALGGVLRRGHTHTHTVGVLEHHTAWLIPNCVSASIFYSRGKWAVTDITAAHTH